MSKQNNTTAADKIEHIVNLIINYKNRSLGRKEQIELDDWVGASDENMLLFEELTDENKMQEMFNWLAKIDSLQILQQIKNHLRFSPYPRFQQFFLGHLW